MTTFAADVRMQRVVLQRVPDRMLRWPPPAPKGEPPLTACTAPAYRRRRVTRSGRFGDAALVNDWGSEALPGLEPGGKIHAG